MWHALTSHEPITGEEFVRIACEISGRRFSLQAAPRWMLSLLGIMSPIVRENLEMLYQFEHDYRFDSSKFEHAFGLTATSYREGIAGMLGNGEQNAEAHPDHVDRDETGPNKQTVPAWVAILALSTVE